MSDLNHASIEKQPQTPPLSNDAPISQIKTSATPASRRSSDSSQLEKLSLTQGRLGPDTRGGHTTLVNTAAADASGWPTSESDPSDDEVPILVSKPSLLSGRSLSNRGLKKDTSHKSPETKRRGSEERYRKFSVGNEHFKTKGRVSKRDGRLNISVNETANRGYLAHALGAAIKHHLNKPGEGDGQSRTRHTEPTDSPYEEHQSQPQDFQARLSTLSPQTSFEGATPFPTLNIVIMVIGSRGDIQPFLKVGKLLKEQHGHHVRVATHPAFKDFVEQDSGLDFFSVGGDPAELMAFMVKNPGLIPSLSTIWAGEISRRRDSMFEMFQGFWRACINAADSEQDVSNVKLIEKHPFVADAIIANPPCFAHVHCAERLGVPLHLMFTFPYTPTQQFPHPLANIRACNVDSNYTNFMSYPLVEMMTWQGLGDLVNKFRVKTLGLEPVSTLWAPGQLYRQKVPYTYMWSPGLIPKPEDWGPEIDIAGFVFLDLASSFEPPNELEDFLNSGQPPVYIGFGSIVVDDSDKFTSLIFKAIEKAGVRALVSKGWGGLGDEGHIPDHVYMLENTPHDWLFPRVSAVVHHGGAGTTAIGLKCGKPTMIVPFFGDQQFWGSMVAKAGAGARKPIPYKHLTADALAEGIEQCLEPSARIAAEKIAENIATEGDGAKNAVQSFLRHLPMQGQHSMRCSIMQDHVAVWTLKHSNLKLSALAAELLVEAKKITWKDVHLLRHYDWNDFEGPGEPFTGGSAAIVRSAGEVVKDVGGSPLNWAGRVKLRKKKGRKKLNPQAVKDTKEAGDSRKTDVQYNDIVENAEEMRHNGEHGGEKNIVMSQRPSHLACDDVKNQEYISSEKTLHRAWSNRVMADQHTRLMPSERPDANIMTDIRKDNKIAFTKTGKVLAKVPMDLSLAVAQGFHNAPRLYGDDTVRTPPRIYGIQSGLRAARSEFTHGVHDGITGLFVHPYNGALEHGPVGFVQGVGKGIGGFVLKDIAAVTGPFGYTMKGIHKELTKNRQPTGFVRRAHIIQGARERQAMDIVTKDRESARVIAAWRIISEIRREDANHKHEGLKGRFAVYREQRQREKTGAYEDLDSAKNALKHKQERRSERESAAAKKDCEGGRGSKFVRKKKSLMALGIKSDRDERSNRSGEEKEIPTPAVKEVTR